jgi:cell wall-associated NlpC family hydrolase
MPVRAHATPSGSPSATPAPSALANTAASVTALCRTLLVIAVAAALLVTGESSGPRASEKTQVVTDELRQVATRTTKVSNALRVAKNQAGDPYRYGGAGPDRFDCSGLVYFSARRAGFSGVPRTSSAQSKHMRRIKRSAMRPGDYVFFHNRSGVYHVAVYLGWRDGKRRILHAPGSGQRVKRSAIWTNAWFPGTLRQR